jgi:hypothetical protein
MLGTTYQDKDRRSVMYLKIMSGENAPDRDPRKTFRLLSGVSSVNFTRTIAPRDVTKPENRLVANQGAKIEVTFEDAAGETFWPEGNCYLMNDAGVTVATFGVAPIDVVARKIIAHEAAEREPRLNGALSRREREECDTQRA